MERRTTKTTPPEEPFEFSWPGKQEAIRMAEAKPTGQLRPCREESVDFDATRNLYIEGDNLDVLKLLGKDYEGRVELIYIDPPYNTGNDFIYNDHFQTEWLNMIYPRLRVARELLSEEGAIFISIDHHEMTHLASVCDEIFGADNRVGLVTVVNNMKGRSDNTFFAICHEFMLVYAKSRRQLSLKGFALENEEMDKDYNMQDATGYYKLIGFRKTGSAWKREERPYMFYPVLYRQGQFATVGEKELARLYSAKEDAFDDEFADMLTRKYTKRGYQVIWPLTKKGEYGRWRWGVDTFNKQKDTNIALHKTGKVCTKMRATMEDGSLRMKSAKTLWYKSEYDTGSAAKALARLMGRADLFQNPKSLTFIHDIVQIATHKDSIVLDFFSGSATTAHAVMLQNERDGGQRQFIMVQLPETASETSEAFKAGYKNICEIGKQRIRLAGQGMKGDTGFKVLKLEG